MHNLLLVVIGKTFLDKDASPLNTNVLLLCNCRNMDVKLWRKTLGKDDGFHADLQSFFQMRCLASPLLHSPLYRVMVAEIMVSCARPSRCDASPSPIATAFVSRDGH
jgi:hypothetical protein